MSLQNLAQILGPQLHREANHLYDGYLPYEFHLRLVESTARRFINLVRVEHHDVVLAACWLHDVLEDTRTSYSYIVKNVSEEVAELVFAVTNSKGRNRAERADDAYYEGINSTPNAVFLKLCDRIANVKYGVLTDSQMVKMYLNENETFLSKLRISQYEPMILSLNTIFLPGRCESLWQKHGNL